MALLLAYIVVPIAVVTFQGFWDPFRGKPTLEWILGLFEKGYIAPLGASVCRVILNSLLLAALSSAIACPLAAVASFLRLQSRKVLDLLSVFPLIVSPLSIGLGYFILEAYFFEMPTLLKLSMLHALLALPLFYRAILGRWSLIPREVVEAAMVDGASRLKAFVSIELPLLSRAFILGISLSMASSLGELALILMLGSDFPTLSLAIYRLFSSHRIEEAKALGSILVVFTLLLFWLAERFASAEGEQHT
jgi:thiamine transport system permease protein